jgi:hypothetical protein
MTDLEKNCLSAKHPLNTVIQLKSRESELPTVKRGRGKNSEYRTREYLTEGEIEKLLAGSMVRFWPSVKPSLRNSASRTW